MSWTKIFRLWARRRQGEEADLGKESFIYEDRK